MDSCAVPVFAYTVMVLENPGHTVASFDTTPAIPSLIRSHVVLLMESAVLSVFVSFCFSVFPSESAVLSIKVRSRHTPLSAMVAAYLAS